MVWKAESGSTRLCGASARVAANTRICRAHCEIEFVVPQFPQSDPGQFVQLRCGPDACRAPTTIDYWPGGIPSLSDQGERTTYLRRPFSIADQWRGQDDQTHLVVISRTVGPGTAWLERLAPGDTCNVTGPLGRGFRIPAGDAPVVLVGGGVGIPPLVYLARRLGELNRRDVTAIFGATTRELLPLALLAEPAPDGKPQRCVKLGDNPHVLTTITTDDGSLGMRGVVTDALRAWCAGRELRTPVGGTVFTCGPQAMLSAVAQATRELGLDCQLCIERTMGCGLGTCQSCVVRVSDQTRPDGWRWALTCTDGPVFDRDELCDQQRTADADARQTRE